MALEAIKSSSAMSYQGSQAQKAEPVRSVETTNFSTTDQGMTGSPQAVKETDSSGKGNQNDNQDENNSQKQNEAIRNAVNKINKSASNTEAVFGIHDETNRVMIKIVDKESKKVIKEFPPEETLDMIAKVWELAGLMVDEKR